MYRKVEDVINEWNFASEGTLSVFKAMTNEKLNQSIEDGHSTLGWLAGHLVGSVRFFGSLAKINVSGPEQKQWDDVTELIESYQTVSNSFKEEVSKLSDDDLLEEVAGIAGPTPRGSILRTLIDHQTHHRGQMTVLLRQAGLTVPPIMGPTKEMQ